MTELPEQDDPIGVGELGETSDQPGLFDVEPCERRYVDAPGWPELK
jgi:hypothetical protein